MADEAADEALGKEQAVNGAGLSTSLGAATGAPQAQEPRGAGVALSKEIDIFPTRPLEQYARPGVMAYEAEDKRQANGRQLALLCGRAAIPRVTLASSYKNMKSPHLMKLLEVGIIQWPLENRQRYTLVFERPSGQRLLQTPDSAPYRISEDRILATLIRPILTVLSDFRNVDMVHGNINMQNIYITGAEGSEAVVLGECVSTAPSMRQHPMYEPIERALAQPSGRGPGTMKDDLYAFGMCVAMIARGENTLRGKTEQQVIAEKIEYTSYGSVIGRDRLPAGISEFLRGVLNDDEMQRWELEDALRWIEGRRLSPKQPRAPMKSARPFIFRERKYWELRSLSDAFARNVHEAAEAIEKDQFDLWLKRNFEDPILEARLEKVWEREKTSSRDKLVSSICMVLDPPAPVRYKHLSIFPTGYANALAEAVANNEDIQTYAELIIQQTFPQWVNLRFEEIVDASGIVTSFEKCRNFLTQKMPGYGIERVLYTLNKEVACLSPALTDYFVLNPGQLLLALEGLSRRADKPEKVLDRHMIAFLGVREAKTIDPHLGYLISAERSNQILGITRTLASIQKRFGTGPVTGVSGWLASMMEPVYMRFNDRDLRAQVETRLKKLGDSGDLVAMQEVIDDPRIVQDDMIRYMNARTEYALLMQERLRITATMKGRKYYGYATGRQVAMVVSSILGFLGLVAYLGMHFVEKL